MLGFLVKSPDSSVSGLFHSHGEAGSTTSLGEALDPAVLLEDLCREDEVGMMAIVGETVSQNKRTDVSW